MIKHIAYCLLYSVLGHADIVAQLLPVAMAVKSRESGLAAYKCKRYAAVTSWAQDA